MKPGFAKAPIIVANLNTLVTAAGTSYFPDLEGKILLLEEMNASLSEEERDLRHLERLGVFDKISGLIVGKPEIYNREGAPFEYEDLILEITGEHRSYPIVTNFDCGHTNPTLTIAEMTPISLNATQGYKTEVIVLEPMILRTT